MSSNNTINIQFVDNFLNQLDDATLLIRDDKKRFVARTLFHITCKTTSVVAAIISIPFAAVRLLFRGIGAAQSLTGRVASLISHTPEYIQRALFPSKLDILQRRIERLNLQLFTRRELTGANFVDFIDEFSKEVSHEEKKELMNAWLDMNEEFISQDESWLEFRFLMNEIADGDFAGDILHGFEKNATETGGLFKDQLPRLPLFVKAFTDIFRKERENKFGLNDDPKVLLSSPHLLKHREVEKFVCNLPVTPLRAAIEQKLKEIHTRILKKMQNEEREIISQLARLLAPLDFEAIKKDYISNSEKRFLETRILVVTEKMDSLRGNEGRDNERKSFKFRMLELEEKHLRDQIEKMTEASGVVDRIQAEGLEETYQVNFKSLEAFHNSLKKRINRTLESVKENSIHHPQSDLILQLSRINDLSIPREEEPTDTYFAQISKITEEVFQLEEEIVSYLPNKYDYLEDKRALLEELNTTTIHIKEAHDTFPWTALQKISRHQERLKNRREALSKDLICISLEKREGGDCQLALHLAAKDARSLELKTGEANNKVRVGNVERKLKKCSEDFVNSVSEKYLDLFQAHLASLEEFITEIDPDSNLRILDQARNRAAERDEIDFEGLSRKVNPQEALGEWSLQLQKIWLSSMPQVDREDILSTSNQSLRKEKMKHLFSRWLRDQTLQTLPFELSFEGLCVEDLSPERKTAIKKLKTGQFLARRQQQSPSPSGDRRENQAGFSTNLIQKPLLSVSDLENVILPGKQLYVQTGGAIISEKENGIELIRRTKHRISLDQRLDSDLKRQEAWVYELAENPRFTSLQDLHLFIRTECTTLGALAFSENQSLGDEVKEIFLNTYKDPATGQLQLEQIENSLRSQFITSFIQMTFAGYIGDITLDETKRKYLVQLISLSELSSYEKENLLGRIKVSAVERVNKFSSIEEVGRALHHSPIGLEGIEEATLQSSFQQSPINTTEQRLYYDMLRARSGTADGLLKPLLSYAKFRNLDHYQDRQSFERALYHAFQDSPEQAKEWIKTNIQFDISSDRFKPESMATPLHIFFTDCLLKLSFTDREMHQRLYQFNRTLIKSNDTHQMLMGFAREVKRLCFLLMAGASTTEDYIALLKCKMAYQTIKKNYFDAKREISGFLQMEIEAAEAAMIQSARQAKEMLHQPDLINQMRDLLLAPLFDDGESFADRNMVKKLANLQPTLQFTVDHDAPEFLSFGVKLQIDAVSGNTYYEGQQQIELSPHYLQNDPTLRSLGLHNLPYVHDSEGAFCYTTEEKGKKIAQVKVIHQVATGNLTIQKRLPISFSDRTPQLLQYIKAEEISLPYSVAHRLSIRNFWLDKMGNCYGYDCEGELVAILALRTTAGKAEYSLQVAGVPGSYSFLTDNEIANPTASGYSALPYLISCYNPNDILVDRDNGPTLSIPGADIKLVWSQQSSVWKCEGKELAGLILDTNAAPGNYIPLKQEGYDEKVAEIKNQLRFTKVRYDEANQPGLSLVGKNRVNQLKRKISSLEKELSEAQGRICFTAMAEEALNPEYFEHFRNEIAALLPAAAYDFLEGSGETAPPYTLFQDALRELNQQLRHLQREQDEHSDDKSIQSRYLAFEQAYKDVKELYSTTCDRPIERTLFNLASDGTIYTADLSGALALLANATNTIEELSSSSNALIKELAKYPITKGLSETQLDYLEIAIQNIENIPRFKDRPEYVQLHVYLLFIKQQHYAYQVEELAHSPLKDKIDFVNKITELSNNAKDRCERGCRYIARERIDCCKELLASWRKSSLAPEELLSISPKASFSEKICESPHEFVERELKSIGATNLIERLFESDSIQSERKITEEELSHEQKSLVKTFHQHSPDQVEGFFLEEFGRFNQGGLYAEFGISRDNPLGLYGLTQSDMKKIFKFLENQQWIVRHRKESYYSLASADYATIKFEKSQIRSLLVDKALTSDEITKITDRLQAFLFRAMQASFKFSFKTQKAERLLFEKLEGEKQLHLQKMLDAEFFLAEKLGKLNRSTVDLKHAFLSGDAAKFEQISPAEFTALRNALVRYLFHKTEVQHIENIEKAPIVGERNRIELLQTRRNYPVDLLFKEGLAGETREEQLMQRAFLVFEEDYGFRCNAMQIRMFRSLMRSSGHEESIDAAQARMGFGKTALLPLMAILRIAFERALPEQERHLVRYVVPRAVIEDNQNSFHQKVSQILGGSVVKDREFTRYQIDDEAREASFHFIKNDLEQRLAFYKEAREHGDVLIQWPEIRGSMEAQELDFGQMLIENKMTPTETKQCIACKRLLAEIRSIATYTVFDELDDTQDIKSREVNYTRGDKKTISKSSIRPLERIIDYVETSTHDFSNLKLAAGEMLLKVGFEPNRMNDSLITYLTDRNQEITREIYPAFSQSLRDAIGSNARVVQESEMDSALFLIRALLLDPNMLALAKSKQPNTHFGARFVERQGERVYFQDPNSGSALLIAVPYEGTNTPKGMSIFDNTEVAAITTIRYYASAETLLSKTPHLDFLLLQIRRHAISDDLAQYYLGELENRDGKRPLDQLKQMAELLDEEELKQAKERFYQDFMVNPDPRFRKFFGVAVVETQIRSDAACTKSDRYEKGSPNSIEKGCSGTVGGTSSYFERQLTDPAADGKLSLEIMGRGNNAPVKELSPPLPEGDYLTQILQTILANANPTTRAVVDAAGICKSRDGTPETIVTELWRNLRADPRFSATAGIIYYGKDNIKRLYRGPDNRSIPCTTSMELEAIRNGKNYFSFYGQKNTRGSDIKQADGAHAIVTIDENVSNSDAKQAILRFRSLVNRDSDQTFSFAFMPSFKSIVKQRLKREFERVAQKVEEKAREKDTVVAYWTAEKPNLSGDDLKGAELELSKAVDERTALLAQAATLRKRATPGAIRQMGIESKEIANYLRLQEIDMEEKGALTIFRKEMEAHVKQAASHLENSVLLQIDGELTDDKQEAYLEFLAKRNNIVPFSSHVIDSLIAKYGTASKDKAREDFIREQLDMVNSKLDDLFEATNDFANAVGVSLEDDRSARDYYTSHCNRSEAFFKRRFSPDTKVQVTHVDAEAQAIAEALAEALALAEAEAESLAEKLSDREVQVAAPLQVPMVRMSNKKHQPVDLSFLRTGNEGLRTRIDCFEPMQNIIHLEHREKFFVSPHVKASYPIAAHYIVTQGDVCIFITQEEANEISRLQNQDAPPDDIDEWSLYDAREISSVRTPLPDWLKRQVPCGILGDNGAIRFTPRTVEDLRNARVLLNVKPVQLLPHLQITAPNGDLNGKIDISKFALSRNIEFDLTVSPSVQVGSTDQISIVIRKQGMSHSFNYERGNEFLDKFMLEAFDCSSVRNARKGKLAYARQLASVEEARYQADIARLNQLKEKLEEQKKDLTRLVSGVKAFEVNDQMKAGLIQRDRESVDRNPTESIYGQQFIDSVNEIETKRQNFVRDPTEDKANDLQLAFDAFVPRHIVEKAKTLGPEGLKSSPLITYEEWVKWKRGENGNSPLVFVYGRILYSIHGDRIHDAVTCSRLDCQQMFATTLPAMLEAVECLSLENLQKVIEDVSQIKAEQERIMDQIAVIERQIEALARAIRKLTEMEAKQIEIEKFLSSIGLKLSNTGEFFDIFNIYALIKREWTDEISLALQGTLPDYKNLVEKDMESYKSAVSALNNKESITLQANRDLLKMVMALSAKLEKRPGEITIK